MTHNQKQTIYITGIFILLLSGCERTVGQQDIEAANAYCKDRGGLFSIVVRHDINIQYITCKNGDKANSNEI